VLIACVDFGSTFTKAALVEVRTGELVATASHRTTIDTDVLDGWDACLEQLCAVEPKARRARVLACSSAGGGLRIGVVGNEELVTAEAGRRVALSSGGRVVHVASGGLTPASLEELTRSRPDVVLLVGGTDGGNAEVLLSCARTLAEASWPGPVVVAGNVEAQPEVAALLDGAGTPYVLAANVVPQIGVLAPDSARAAIREMFLRHVIGGKHLSQRADFTAMVRGATPDVVLTAVELLAHGLDEEHPGAGDVVVVDIGGATTDVHSVVELDPEDAGLSRQVVATVPVTAPSRATRHALERGSTVQEGLAADVLPPSTRTRSSVPPRYATPTRRTCRHPEETAPTRRRRRGRGGRAAPARRAAAGRSDRTVRVVERSGKTCAEVDLLVGSGGVLRNNPPEVTDRLLGLGGRGGARGRQLPVAPGRGGPGVRARAAGLLAEHTRGGVPASALLR
jgi:hypothetical protein